MAANSKLTPGEIAIVAGGAVGLIASFLAWVDVGGYSANAWDDGFFPTYTWPAIFGLVMAALVLLTSFGNVSLPDRPLGFTWQQLFLVMGAFSVLITFSFLIAGEEVGIGFFLAFLAAIAGLVGAVMVWREGTTPGRL